MWFIGLCQCRLQATIRRYFKKKMHQWINIYKQLEGNAWTKKSSGCNQVSRQRRIKCISTTSFRIKWTIESKKRIKTGNGRDDWPDSPFSLLTENIEDEEVETKAELRSHPGKKVKKTPNPPVQVLQDPSKYGGAFTKWRNRRIPSTARHRSYRRASTGHWRTRRRWT